MPEKKPSAIARITGSTDSPAADLTPRSSFMAFATGAAGLASYVFSTDATLTGIIFGLTTNGAFLSLVLFDAVVKPRL